METPKHLQADIDNVAKNAPVHAADSAADRAAEIGVISAAEQHMQAVEAGTVNERGERVDGEAAAPADLEEQVSALKEASDIKIERVRGEETDGGDVEGAVEAQEEVAEVTGNPAPVQVGEKPGDKKAATGADVAEAKADAKADAKDKK